MQAPVRSRSVRTLLPVRGSRRKVVDPWLVTINVTMSFAPSAYLRSARQCTPGGTLEAPRTRCALTLAPRASPGSWGGHQHLRSRCSRRRGQQLYSCPADQILRCELRLARSHVGPRCVQGSVSLACVFCSGWSGLGLPCSVPRSAAPSPSVLPAPEGSAPPARPG
jgi:hypothetical protein